MNAEPKATILTIEDEPAFRRGIAAFLTKRGFHVLEAEDGLSGLSVFQRENPDLVLVDLRMPEIDGLEVLASIVKESPQTPVLVVSGTGNIADVVEALRLGAWDYLLKPLPSVTVLEHAICRALERARLRRENEESQRRVEEALRIIREDEEAGRKIQLRLLPPHTSTIGPYALVLDITPSTYLSGDFVDYFSVNGDCVAFFTADVSGHGVSSALVTVLLKGFLRKYVDKYHADGDQTILEPGVLMRKLNDELLREDLEKHVTAFFGLLTTPDNTLTFASAGQFPFPIVWRNGTPELIREKGTAAGLFPFAKYHSATMQLPDDFLIAIFSDGILEVMPQPDLARKVDYLQSLDNEADMHEFVTQLRTNRALPDDVTLLTIRRGTHHARP